jgi:hypothetical protein
MIRDTILSAFFHDPEEHPPRAPGTLPATAREVVALGRRLRVMTVDPAQQRAITGNGKVDQRCFSSAYLELLRSRPHLGRSHHLTPERFEHVIKKDARYDALTVHVEEAQEEVAAARLRARAGLSRAVGALLSHVAARLAEDDDDTPAHDALRANFLFIGVKLGRKDRRRHRQKMRDERRQKRREGGGTP